MISGSFQDDTSLVELGAALRRLRTDSGLSLRGLARSIGLNAHSALADYERGRRMIPENLLPRFAAAVGDTDGAIAASLAALRERAAADLAELAEQRHAVAERDTAPAGPAPVPAPSAAVPPAPADFVGRLAELERLREVLTGGALVVLSGPPGAGKSSLAARAATEAAADFPDGAILLDLCDPNPTEAMRKALRACGIADRALPSDVDELGSLYRAVLATRRMLVVIDGAAHEDQALPLLASSPGSALLVTSRGPLHGLDTARAVHRCRIGPLTEDDAVDLVAAVLGRSRVDAEPAAARRMAALCDRWPLALRIAAARLVDWPGGLLADAVTELEREHARHAWLPVDSRAVRGVLEVSYRQLDEPARRLLRRLALAPGGCFTVETAAVALGESLRSVRRELDRLHRAGFLRPAATEGRSRMHVLVRGFARSRAEQDEPARQEVELRLLHALLETAADAAGWLDPTAQHDRESAFGGIREAVRWLDAERTAILAAAEKGCHLDPGWGLVGLLRQISWYYRLRCAWPDLRTLAQLALEQAQLQQDTEDKAHALAALSLAAAKTGQPDTARELAETAAGLAHGDTIAGAEVAALDCLGRALLALNRPDAARQALARAVSLRGDWWQHAVCSSRLGVVLAKLGEPARGLELQRHALTLFDGHGDDRGAARTRLRLGFVLVELDRHAEAVEQYDRACVTFERFGDTWSQAGALREVGNGRLVLGEDERAAADLRRADALFAAQGCR
ncbi:hypothetical protein GCM10022247_71470 [Allokutzneria multivorans]|uniref:HTH cro/C1-type domain-containing protein n=1 Tax=Allokutzneria multivorans TaxID=1142134 RepID=A0ABP7U3N6_9PSEU